MNKPLLLIDFDGVIYIDGPPTSDNSLNGDMVPGALEFMRGALLYFDIAINSHRSLQYPMGGVTAMRDWLLTQALRVMPNDTTWLHMIQFPLGQASAAVHIGARSITYAGQWPTHSELLEFRPWHDLAGLRDGSTRAVHLNIGPAKYFGLLHKHIEALNALIELAPDDPTTKDVLADAFATLPLKIVGDRVELL
jgi:hypothetical protein